MLAVLGLGFCAFLFSGGSGTNTEIKCQRSQNLTIFYPQKMLSLYFEFIRLFCSEANWFSKKQNFSLRFFLLMFGLRVMVKRDGRTGWIPSFFNDWQKATESDKQSCVNWNCLTDNLTLGDSLVGCSFCSTFGDTGKSEDCSRGGGTSN